MKWRVKSWFISHVTKILCYVVSKKTFIKSPKMEIALATNFTDASDQVIWACYLRSLCIELFRNVIRQNHRVSLQVCTNFCFHRRQSRYNYMVYHFGTIGLIHINTIRCCFVLRRSIRYIVFMCKSPKAHKFQRRQNQNKPGVQIPTHSP